MLPALDGTYVIPLACIIVGGGDPTLVTQFAVVANSLAVRIHVIVCSLFSTASLRGGRITFLAQFLLAEEDANYSRGILSSFFFVWPVRHILCLRGLVRTEA